MFCKVCISLVLYLIQIIQDKSISALMILFGWAVTDIQKEIRRAIFIDFFVKHDCYFPIYPKVFRSF